MPTFPERRCARPPAAVGRTEQTAGLVILLLLVGLVATFIVDVTRRHDPLWDVPTSADVPAGSEPSAAAPAFPDPDLPDWRPPARVERFTRDDLHVKIDGQAEAYLPLGVVSLSFGTYIRRDDAARYVDVYWYDMGAADGARRIFELEQPTGTTAESIGDAAYISGGAVFFRRGANYVQVLPARPEDADVARRIAARLAAGM